LLETRGEKNQSAKRTFDGLAVPGCRDFGDGFRYCPVLVSNFDQTLSDLGRVICSLEDIGATACDGFFSGGTDNYSFGADGRKTINVGSDVKFDDVALGERLLCKGVRCGWGEVGDTVVDGNACWERKALR
jgi:hypothetical protein